MSGEVLKRAIPEMCTATSLFREDLGISSVSAKTGRARKEIVTTFNTGWPDVQARLLPGRPVTGKRQRTRLDRHSERLSNTHLWRHPISRP